MKTPFSLFALILLFFTLGCKPAGTPAISPTTVSGDHFSVLSQHHYAVHQQLVLTNRGAARPEKQNLWVALIRDFPPYQAVTSMTVSPQDYQLVIDEYGNQYAEFDFSGQPPGSTRTVEIDYRVTVNELSYDLSLCHGELLNDFIYPELHIEALNPQVMDLARRLTGGKDTVCQQVEAFYDYIGDELVYTPNEANWGAQATFGTMGSDCTEYASLLVALSRAEGIPARYFEGLLYQEDDIDPIAKEEHAWPDVYLPTVGWTALDPTLGRPPAERETYFAHYTPDHIIVTMGVNPSVLRGGSYWTYLYWPGNTTQIQLDGEWKINLMNEAGQ